MESLRHFSLPDGQQAAKTISPICTAYYSDGDPNTYYLVSPLMEAKITLPPPNAVSEADPMIAVETSNGGSYLHSAFKRDDLTRMLRYKFDVDFLGDPVAFMRGQWREARIITLRIAVATPPQGEGISTGYLTAKLQAIRDVISAVVLNERENFRAAGTSRLVADDLRSFNINSRGEEARKSDDVDGTHLADAPDDLNRKQKEINDLKEALTLTRLEVQSRLIINLKTALEEIEAKVVSALRTEPK